MTVPADHLAEAALDPVRPAYGTGSLADLLPSVCAVLGMPGLTDVLGLTARLDGVDRVGVLLVDGLGAYQMPVVSAYAPVLEDLAVGSGTLTAGFPSTTPVSLVTVGTGALPGAHGVLGFTTRRPDGRVLNHIRWWDDPDPRLWQPVPTLFERASANGIAVTVVSRPEYEGSGLSLSANRGARYVGAPDGASVADQMLAALSGPGPRIVYGYHPDLDHFGHQDGVDSPSWREAAVGVGALLDRLVHGLPARSCLLVVADHGQLNVPLEGRFDMGGPTEPARSASPTHSAASTPTAPPAHPAGIPPVGDKSDLSDGVIGVAGEPRVRYLYAAPGARDDVLAAWRSVLGAAAWVLTRDEAIAQGWYGPVPDDHIDRIGEIVVVCRARSVVLATGWEPPIVGRLVAYHGGLTAAEMTVPLLIAR